MIIKRLLGKQFLQYQNHPFVSTAFLYVLNNSHDLGRRHRCESHNDIAVVFILFNLRALQRAMVLTPQGWNAALLQFSYHNLIYLIISWSCYFNAGISTVVGQYGF